MMEFFKNRHVNIEENSSHERSLSGSVVTNSLGHMFWNTASGKEKQFWIRVYSL